MVDAARQIRGGEFAGAETRAHHPFASGSLAVSLIALLVLSIRSCVRSEWNEPMGLWLFAGALLWVAASWAFAARRTPGEGAVATMQVDGSAARGVRRHRRYVPGNRTTVLYTQDGRHIPGRIANISVAAVAVDAKLSDLDYVAISRVGSRDVGPIRRTPTGAVFGFTNFLEPQMFDKSFVL